MSFHRLAARVAIVIPAFNEAKSIDAIVSGVAVFGTPIVVNDGSTDNTEQVAAEAGALLVCHEGNLGYDRALTSGIAKALAEGFDFVITLDGDGQHEPIHIRSFLFQLKEGADLVIGIRDRYQRVSEKIFSVLAKWLWGIEDPLCGMKGYRLSKLERLQSLSSYPSIGTELAIRGARSGWNIHQVAVSTCDRNGTSRFGIGLYANWRIFRAMLTGLLHAKAYATENKST